MSQRPVVADFRANELHQYPKFTDDEHGARSSRCFPLVAGYWSPSRRHAFTDSTFKICLGALGRKVRECQIKAMTSDLLTRFGVSADAKVQQFHHSKQVQQKHLIGASGISAMHFKSTCSAGMCDLWSSCR